jgi:hypothetical protein
LTIWSWQFYHDDFYLLGADSILAIDLSKCGA